MTAQAPRWTSESVPCGPHGTSKKKEGKYSFHATVFGAVAAGRAPPASVFRTSPAEGGMNQGFFYRRLVRPLLDLLRQGATPEKLALSVALGAMLGVFPMLGATTT